MNALLSNLVHQLDFMSDEDKAERLTTEAIEHGGSITVGHPTRIDIHGIDVAAADPSTAIHHWITAACAAL